jgi:hypothetical protein
VVVLAQGVGAWQAHHVLARFVPAHKAQLSRILHKQHGGDVLDDRFQRARQLFPIRRALGQGRLCPAPIGHLRLELGIGLRQLFQQAAFSLERGVKLERFGGLGGQQAQQRLVVVGKQRALLREKRQHPPDTLAGHDGHDQQ